LLLTGEVAQIGSAQRGQRAAVANVRRARNILATIDEVFGSLTRSMTTWKNSRFTPASTCNIFCSPRRSIAGSTGGRIAGQNFEPTCAAQFVLAIKEAANNAAKHSQATQ